MTSQILACFLLISTFLSCGPEKLIVREHSDGNLQEQKVDEVYDDEEFGRHYQYQLDWKKAPKAGSKASPKFVLTFSSLHDHKVDVQSFDIRIYMKVHQHGGIDKKRKIQRLDASRPSFEVSNFYFTMSGPWEILVQVHLDKKLYHLEIPISVS